jgi:hypothetical protein
MHTRYVADFFCLRRRSSPYSRRRCFIATQAVRFVEFKNHDGPRSSDSTSMTNVFGRFNLLCDERADQARASEDPSMQRVDLYTRLAACPGTSSRVPMRCMPTFSSTRIDA